MNNDQNSVQDMETVRIDYQVAVDLLKSEEEGIWARSNVMLLANSIAVTAISLGLTSENKPPILTIGLPIFGLFLCIMWIFLIKRGFDYRKYFVLSARELEAHLPNSAIILSRGKIFADGKNVKFEIPDEQTYQMSCLARLSSENIAYLVIGAFIILYFHILFLN